jgi:predicted DNA-binding helix-hairpin-helix protein
MGEIEIKWIYNVFDLIKIHVQFNQFVQLNDLNIDSVFEIRELDFVHRVFQANRHDKMYNLTSEKIIEIRSKFFEERIETGGKFKYKDTGDIGVK